MKLSAVKIKKDKNLIIDVRTPKEYKEKHIPGSFNIPLSEIHRYKDELKGVKKNVAFLCRTGSRASEACDILKKHDMDSRVVDGGIQAWESEGFEITYGPKTWSLERQVRLGAGGMVALGAALGFAINPYWHILSGFVGLGLVFAALTNTCGMAFMLSKAPWNKVKHDTKKVVNELGDV